MASMAVFLNLFAVLAQLLSPILADAIGEDRDLVVRGPVDVDCIPALVLAPAEGLNPSVAIESHQVMAEALELVIICQVFETIDDGISSHWADPSRRIYSQAQRHGYSGKSLDEPRAFLCFPKQKSAPGGPLPHLTLSPSKAGTSKNDPGDHRAVGAGR